MLQGLSNLAGLFRAAQQMGPKLQAVQQRLRDARVTGSAGGDMVTVTANGLSAILSIQIEPTLVSRGDAEMIQDLTVAAVNNALEKAKELHLREMQSLTEGVDMPGMEEMLARMTGTGS